MPRADWGWINVTPYYDTTTFTPGGVGGGSAWTTTNYTLNNITTTSGSSTLGYTYNFTTVPTANWYLPQRWIVSDDDFERNIVNGRPAEEDPWGPAPMPTWRLVDEGTGRTVERVAAEQDRLARVEARAVARTEARDRADELLLLLLSQEQQESYRLTGEFEVMGSAGGLYRIRRGTSGNVDWIMPGGQVGARLCAHPTMDRGWLPDQDVALAQMLALTTDEPAFIRKANIHAGRRPAHLAGVA